MARKGTTKARAGAGAEADTPAPPRLRLKLKTIADVRGELSRLYREGKAGRRNVNDVSKLANVLSILGRLIEGSDFEARLEAMERMAEERRTQQGGAITSRRH